MTGKTYLKLNFLKRKIPFKALFHYKGTSRKEKDFRKLSNKEIYFIVQSNSTKWYKKPFRLILCPNFLEGHHILSEGIQLFCLVYNYSFFSSLKPCTTYNGQRTKRFVCQIYRTRRISTPIYIFLQALQNYYRLHQWTNQSELLF